MKRPIKEDTDYDDDDDDDDDDVDDDYHHDHHDDDELQCRYDIYRIYRLVTCMFLLFLKNNDIHV